jgi:arsenical pump membrane protein
MQASSTTAIYLIAGLATAAVIVRPWRLPEWIWATLGAAALVASGLLPWADALAGIRKGLNVYLFLAGMMLLAELGRREGLFAWLAALAVEHAGGSGQRLFTLVYGVGIAVTVLLSNDATAVVLTPAVYAAARAAGAEPLPYLLICAFVANAASFVLPISNPANLVVFGDRMPQLAAWLAQFLLPSVLAIAASYLALWLTQRHALRAERIASSAVRPALGMPGRLTACGIGCTGIVLIASSALDRPLGLPTFIAGAVTTAIVIAAALQNPWRLLRGISWGVLPLVAGLFVMVEAVERTGAIAALAGSLGSAGAQSANVQSAMAVWSAGSLLALVCNIMNNLPAGLIAGAVLANDHLPRAVSGAMLVGVDLGPNLSVTGSLATILWLIALRREDQHVSAWQFLKLGAVVMPPALILALAALVLLG